MFKIDQHIEYLLLNHSCVIVPDFGGFVVHQVSAKKDSADGMMLPPAVTVGFNPQLTLNDSLLIQSFVEAYDMSYPEAQREVEKETKELRGLISDNGIFEICSIGSIRLNESGKYEFEPCKAGIVVPRLYGLSGIETLDEVSFMKTVKPKPLPAETGDVTTDEEEDTLEEGHPMVRKLAIACAALLLLAAIPFFSNSGNTHKLLSGIDLSFFTSLMPKSEVKQVTTTIKVEPYHIYVYKKTASEVTKEERQTETSSESSADPSTEAYTIVLASKVSNRNASIYVNDLKALGFKDVRVIGEGRNSKVVMGSYKTKAEARKARCDISRQTGLSCAWVMKMEER